jgi:hypothetical protein
VVYEKGKGLNVDGVGALVGTALWAREMRPQNDKETRRINQKLEDNRPSKRRVGCRDSLTRRSPTLESDEDIWHSLYLVHDT